MSRRGLTLIELLAALALLGLLAVAAASWLRVAGRSARAVHEHAGAWSGQSAALRLLRDDLRLGSAVELNADGDELQLLSLHGLTGPGRHQLRWRVADGALLRIEDAGDPRPVLEELPAQRFERDEAGELWWLLGPEGSAGVLGAEVEHRHLVWSAAW